MELWDILFYVCILLLVLFWLQYLLIHLSHRMVVSERKARKMWNCNINLPNFSALGKLQHKINFLTEYCWFKFSFPSSRVVIIQKLKGQFYLTIYPLSLVGGRKYIFIPFHWHLCELKHKQLRPGFELASSSSFFEMITVTLHSPPIARVLWIWHRRTSTMQKKSDKKKGVLPGVAELSGGNKKRDIIFTRQCSCTPCKNDKITVWAVVFICDVFV